ncbi:hypothetical protein BGZ76_009096 [Entomortierella beljakovae]|nr:hypothetical protein BGZ76_009096 [Entomortierella beljakovae]
MAACIVNDNIGGPNLSLQTKPKEKQFISENNARFAAVNNNAFVQFCRSSNKNKNKNKNNKQDNISDTTFQSYNDWMKYINTYPEDNPSESTTSSPSPPRYLERPLKNWVINLTDVQSACNRLIHTSAHCLEFLTQEHKYLIPSNPSTYSEKMDFHVFWRGPITDKLALSASSFLYTQPLKRSKLHWWIDSSTLPDGVPEDYTKNRYAAPFVSEPLNQFVEIHAWDQAAELNFSYGDSKEIGHSGSSPVAFSDEARFLILNRHGGIYLDADVLLLRDMSPFFDSGLEFAYEWSNTRMYNTAVLRLFPGSSVARRILDGAKAREADIQAKKNNESVDLEKQEVELDDLDLKKRSLGKREMRPEQIYHPARLREYLSPKDKAIEGNGLVMMSTAVFDPLWLRVDHQETKNGEDNELMLEDLRTFGEVFSTPSAVCPGQAKGKEKTAADFTAGPEVFLNGAYAYHWHNGWETPILPNSWMGILLQAYTDFEAGERPNLYGEWLETIL